MKKVDQEHAAAVQKHFEERAKQSEASPYKFFAGINIQSFNKEVEKDCLQNPTLFKETVKEAEAIKKFIDSSKRPGF